jgi:hypothetical protein
MTIDQDVGGLLWGSIELLVYVEAEAQQNSIHDLKASS